MCRLFGLTAGTNRVKATFWLLDAPDSLQVQSHRNADGAGLGYFGPDGEPVLDKQPVPAYRDQEFQRAARQAESTAFVAHVRWATAGGRAERNTHPFGPGELWALRYPGQHALHILERPAEPGEGQPGLHVRSATSSVHAPSLDSAASVAIASEEMDGESGWRMLEPGELVHVRPDLSVESRMAVPDPPAHLVPLPPGSPNIDT